MWSYVDSKDQLVGIINRATPYYIAAIAVAIGFRMNLFNIGVDGQYRLAALIGGAVGGALDMPALMHVSITMLVAMLVGMSWAAIPAVLKVTRGVNEVVATIMLNFIATGLSAYLLLTYLKDEAVLDRTQIAQTSTLPPSGRFPNLDRWLPFDLSPRVHLQGYVLVAIVLGVAMHIMLSRTRFGLKLRTSGANAATARSSGVSPNRMIVTTFLISGGLAGLAAMGPLLAERWNYSDTFPTGVGFVGISVALLGQNSPGGIAVAAFIWAGVEAGARGIQNGPPEITKIMLGALLLSAVIAFTAMKRRAELAAVREAAAQATHSSRGTPAGPAADTGMVTA
jgi:simple sugar transport system permease protein